MKFAAKEDGSESEDRLIGVELLTDDDDVLLATRDGKAIRFAGDAVRSFQSRTSTGMTRLSPFQYYAVLKRQPKSAINI